MRCNNLALISLLVAGCGGAGTVDGSFSAPPTTIVPVDDTSSSPPKYIYVWRGNHVAVFELPCVLSPCPSTVNDDGGNSSSNGDASVVSSGDGSVDTSDGGSSSSDDAGSVVFLDGGNDSSSDGAIIVVDAESFTVDSGSNSGQSDGGSSTGDSGSGSVADAGHAFDSGSLDGGSSDSGVASDGGVVDSCRTPICVLTQGFWKTHLQSWKTFGLTLGDTFYTEAQCLTIFNTPPHGDASLILADQLMTALLNGLQCTDQLHDVLVASQAWMVNNQGTHSSLPYGIAASSPAGSVAVQLASALNDWNNGSTLPECETVQLAP